MSEIKVDVNIDILNLWKALPEWVKTRELSRLRWLVSKWKSSK